MGKQGRGRRLTDRERLEINEFARQNPQVKHVELAATYHVNESTIRKWRRESNATKVRARCASSGSHQRRRGQAERVRQFDLQLYNWICAARTRGEKLRPIQVRTKARALATSYEQMSNFKASSGWYYRYCRRVGLMMNATTSLQAADSPSRNSSDASDNATESMVDLLTSKSSTAGSAVQLQDDVESSTRSHVHEPEEGASACQAAIAHFLHHHTALLSRASRSRFIQYLADVPEELKAFAQMTSPDRVLFAKCFGESLRMDTTKECGSSYTYRTALVL